MEKVRYFGWNQNAHIYYLETNARSEFQVTPHHSVVMIGFVGVERPALFDSLQLIHENGVISLVVRHVQPQLYQDRKIQLAEVSDSPRLRNWIAKVNSLFF